MTSIGGKAQELIGARLLEHEKLVHKVMGSKRLLKAIEEAAGLISLTLASGGKVMFCGNQFRPKRFSMSYHLLRLLIFLNGSNALYTGV